MIAGILERLWSELTTGVAVDASRIDEKLAEDVFGKALCDIGHGSETSWAGAIGIADSLKRTSY
jgi:hypothetical protein